MVRLRYEELEQTIEVGRLIGRAGDGDGPTLVVAAGLHGNEPSGVFALHRVFEKLREDGTPVRGRFIGLAGHLEALGKHERFIDEDLNRAWIPAVTRRLAAGDEPASTEQREMAALLREIEALGPATGGPRYFVDCHTTSAESQPYISVRRDARSLDWSGRFPVYIVSGLEQVIRGTLVDHVSEAGWTAFTFEAGRHDDLASVENQEACIWLALAHAGCVERESVGCYPHCHEVLMKTVIEGRRLFRLAEHYRIQPGERFRMRPGFVNFQPVRRGQPLADNDEGPIESGVDGRILMPLYQAQGEDGFFLVTEERVEAPPSGEDA